MYRFIIIAIAVLLPTQLFGMHIAEGYLPANWAIGWAAMFLPFLFFGVRKIKSISEKEPKAKMLFAVVGAFVFVLSSVKLPSLGGSSSHLTGIALGAILFGASSMSIIGLIVLLFQALLLAHGGITTLGANAFSMAVVGSVVAIIVYRTLKAAKISSNVSVFITAFVSDIAIYMCTSAQLALAFQSSEASFGSNFLKFISVFAVTQIPLAVIEGLLTVLIFNLIVKYNSNEIAIINPSLKV